MAVLLLLIAVVITFTAVGMLAYSLQADIDAIIAGDRHYAVDGMSPEEYQAHSIRVLRVNQALLMVLAALFGFVTVALSLFLLRGRRGARVFTWIFSGALVAITAVVAVFSASALTGDLGHQARAMDLLIPVLSAALALTYGLVILLLSMRDARWFFASARPAAGRRVSGPRPGN